MGYDTTFRGRFGIEPRLEPAHAAYLQAFSESRRVSWVNCRLADPVREAVGLGVGIDGCYITAGGMDPWAVGLDNRSANTPPAGQPGLWCDWTPSEDGTALIWNGMEKSSEYVAWLDYLVDTFLVPWGYTLSGAVLWQGEGEDDTGLIVVHNNRSPALKVTSARVALALAEAVDSEAIVPARPL